MNKINELEKSIMRKDAATFDVGDTVKVFVKIREGDKTRLQGFEGTVIGKKHSGARETFTVRRVAYGEGVERIFQLHSPALDSVKVVKKGKVGRAKLYYLRGKFGKYSKIEEERASQKQGNALLGEEGIS